MTSATLGLFDSTSFTLLRSQGPRGLLGPRGPPGPLGAPVRTLTHLFPLMSPMRCLLMVLICSFQGVAGVDGPQGPKGNMVGTQTP